MYLWSFRAITEAGYAVECHDMHCISPTLQPVCTLDICVSKILKGDIMNTKHNDNPQSKGDKANSSSGPTPHISELSILKTWLSRRQWLLKPVLHR